MNFPADTLLPAASCADAVHNLRAILDHAIVHDTTHAALVVYDARSPLSRTLTQAYRANLPQGHFLDFDAAGADAVLAAFDTLRPGDLVVTVQTTNFRLDAYRLRVELFKRGLKVIEHVHLSRMPAEQGERYIDGLAYDPAYYRGVGVALKARIDGASAAVVDSGGERLEFGPLEPAKLNVGDYTGMANVGGQFPIGEVFTEARDLESVHGRVRIFVFGDTSFLVNRPLEPITLVVERGRVTQALGSTPAFDAVLEQIRAVEGEVWLRELGFGMNRAFTRERTVDDIGTYERMCGVHLSLGAKHGVYTKPGFKRKDARFHIDVFAVTEAVWLDDACVYRDGAWQP
jgi:aminopeptidase